MDLPKTLHLVHPPGYGEWALPLKARLQNSSSTRVKSRLQQSDQGDLWEKKASALSTTLALGERIVSRINARLEDLSRDVQDNPQDLLDDLASHAVYIPADEYLTLDLLIDLDAFLFEFESAQEKLRRFLRAFYKQILEQDVSVKKLRAAVLSWGIDLSWERKLKKLRNRFIHETTPWVGLSVTNLAPMRAELILLDDATTVPLAGMGEILSGFRATLWAIRKHLADEEIHSVELEERIEHTLDTA